MISCCAKTLMMHLCVMHKYSSGSFNLLRGFMSGANSFNHKNSVGLNKMPQDVKSSLQASGMNAEDNIVWVDTELTGLDTEKDHLLEVACLVTDGQLNIIAEGPDIVIHQPPDILANMNDWCKKYHNESGLTQECETSTITLRDAEKQLLEFVREWAPYKQCPLAGNTIYMDRIFLMKHMQEFEQHLHYRIIDVSSVKELFRRWYPDKYINQPNKKEDSKHRALYDIKASINELKFYKENMFHQGINRKQSG